LELMTTKTPLNGFERMLATLPTITVVKTAFQHETFEVFDAATATLNQRLLSDDEAKEIRTYVLGLFDPKAQRADGDHYLHIKEAMGDIVSSIEEVEQRKKWVVLYKDIQDGLIEAADEADLIA
jgi:hypothetical protein